MATDEASVTTLNHKGSSAQVCRDRGWGPGTRLIGDEGYGPTIIELTAVGDHNILAKTLAHNGRAVAVHEASWVLHCRDWREYADDCPQPFAVDTQVLVTVAGLVLDHEPGAIIAGPDGFGFYGIHLPRIGQWIRTDQFELAPGAGHD